MYEYKATIVSVYDGDTITVDIDLGFHTTMRMNVRIARIDAPEVKGKSKEQGHRTRDRLRDLLPVGAEVVVTTYKDGREKYGRYLASIRDKQGFDIASTLVGEGLAVFKEYL